MVWKDFDLDINTVFANSTLLLVADGTERKRKTEYYHNIFMKALASVSDYETK